MELYIHIPFCVRKCAYCDFLSFPQTKEIMQQYVEKLIEEIRWAGKQYPGRAISSIFIGGGTPSILKAEQMTAIMHAVREVFYIEETAEISMEANPGTLTPEKLQWAKRVGINRLSMGLQSANENELKILNNLVSGYFDLAEISAIEHRPMYMEDYVKQLDLVLTSGNRKLLEGAGTISHQQAIDKAKCEYRKYQKLTLSSVEKEYLETVKDVSKKVKNKK